MNWNETAPDGTAAWCDDWRARYDQMQFSEHQWATDSILEAHQKQEGFDAGFLEECLERIQSEFIDSPFRVIEFGGWRGELAARILKGHKWITLWDNFEISTLALSGIEALSPRYSIHVPNGFVWTHPPVPGEMFVSSHSIEHISLEHLKLLFGWIHPSVRYLWLQAPLPEDCVDNKWDGYGGTHILNVGWKQVISMLSPEFRLELRGGIRNECLLFKRS